MLATGAARGSDEITPRAPKGRQSLVLPPLRGSGHSGVPSHGLTPVASICGSFGANGAYPGTGGISSVPAS